MPQGPSHNKRHKSCVEIASEKKKEAKTGGKTGRHCRVRLSRSRLAAASTKAKLGKKKEKVKSKSPPRKGEKDVTTKATKKSVAAKKPTVTKTKTGTIVKKKIGSHKKIGSGKFLSPAKLNELTNAAGSCAGFRRIEHK